MERAVVDRRDYEHIRLDIADGVARLVLARPQALNALSRSLLGEVIDALEPFRTIRYSRP